MKNMFFFIIVLSLSLSASAAPQTKTLEGKNLLMGGKVEVNASGKKGMVVIFLSAKCPCSNSHNIEIRDLAETYKEFNFVAVHSNVDEGKELKGLFLSLKTEAPDADVMAQVVNLCDFKAESR